MSNSDLILAADAMSREECEARISSGQPFQRHELAALAALTRSRKDTKYWFTDGKVIEIGGRTVKVHLSLAFGEIPALKDWIIASEDPSKTRDPSHPQLGSEAYPMVLQGGEVIGYKNMLQWLKYIYQKYNFAATVFTGQLVAMISTYRKEEFNEEELTHLLQWGHFWAVEHAVKFAKDELVAMIRSKPCSVYLGLARQFLIGEFVEPGLEQYIDISATPQLKEITDNDIYRMGYRAYEIIARTRETNFQRRMELAMIAPSMGVPEDSLSANDCTLARHETCRQAWKEGWRNEVAARLLDKRTPIPFHLISSFIHTQVIYKGPRQTPSAYSQINQRCAIAAVDNLVYGPDLDNYGWTAIKNSAVERVKKLYGCWRGNDVAVDGGITDEFSDEGVIQSI
ncbi:hypothetical protein PM082_004975 [Marasmius tenuissimus]|nr:hypothetical protein PM082_004975 [Marasmius tenuissimus]